MENSKSRPIEADTVSESVADCLLRRTRSGQRLVVGLSGGMDSVALLHCLRGCCGSRNLTLTALHVHHALSPNADHWARYCENLCEQWNIPFICMRVTVERGSSDGLEAAARRARHEIFARTEADWIVLAHHRDDQAETMLFNLLRGTGVAGAAGMAETSGRLLRPLLGVGREAITTYAHSHALHWVDDESNTDTRLSRNHLRHEVLAGLERRFPGSSANLAAAARRFGEARHLLDELARADLGQPEPDFPVEVRQLASLDEPRARNALRYLLQKRHIGIPSEQRLREALRQLVDAAPDRHPAVVFGHWRLLRKGRQVHMEAAD